ncbi:nucleoid-associated protein [Polaribacter atrinae]|uniref:nucleoid-associated protein n=1 Tax=Polaribacter atrinae TaxID=1333662 RepID=UPI0030F971AF
MSNIDIKLLSLHQLDVSSNSIEKISIDVEKETIIKYVDALIDEILENPNKRLYKFKEGKTEVKNSIPDIISNFDDIENVLLTNAKRLLEKEVATDKKIQKLGVKVQRGSLLHIHFKQGKSDNLLICKVEHDEIINEKSFELNRGLNTKKKVFKAFLYYLGNDIRNEEIYLNDKNNSKYWWSDFLELEQVNTNDANTEKSLDKLVKIIDKEKNKEGLALDGTLLRNSIVGYFKTKKEFNFTEVYDIVNNYQPFNPKFPLTNIISKFDKLKDDKSFDNQFSIIQKKVDKRIVNTIPLGKGLYLKIDKHVPNLTEIIKPYEGIDGKFGITIISDQAYNFIKVKNK